MTFSYPLFVLDTQDKSVYMLKMKKELNAFEEPEVVEGTFKVWSINGDSLEMFWNTKKNIADVKINNVGKDRNGLRQALLNYARFYNSRVDAVLFKEEIHFDFLYLEIKKGIFKRNNVFHEVFEIFAKLWNKIRKP